MKALVALTDGKGEHWATDTAPCVHCGAMVGVRCRMMPSGKTMYYPHAARLALAPPMGSRRVTPPAGPPAPNMSRIERGGT